MATNKIIIDKVRLTLTQPEITFDLKAGYVDVSASHLKWLTYVTASTGNTDMTIKIAELGEAGTKYTYSTGANKRYFVSMPLDPSSQVTNIYANYTGALDKEYEVPRSLNSFSFQVLINGILAYDVTLSNPVELELVLYK